MYGEVPLLTQGIIGKSEHDNMQTRGPATVPGRPYNATR